MGESGSGSRSGSPSISSCYVGAADAANVINNGMDSTSDFKAGGSNINMATSSTSNSGSNSGSNRNSNSAGTEKGNLKARELLWGKGGELQCEYLLSPPKNSSSILNVGKSTSRQKEEKHPDLIIGAEIAVLSKQQEALGT